VAHMPERIQRSRAKGSRMPEGAVYVGRPTKFDNPFRYRTPYGLCRMPALDGSAWEYEGPDMAPALRKEPLVYEEVHMSSRSYK